LLDFLCEKYQVYFQVIKSFFHTTAAESQLSVWTEALNQ